LTYISLIKKSLNIFMPYDISRGTTFVIRGRKFRKGDDPKLLSERVKYFDLSIIIIQKL